MALGRWWSRWVVRSSKGRNSVNKTIMSEREKQVKAEKKAAEGRQEQLLDRMQNGPEDEQEEEIELPDEVEHDGEVYDVESWVGARRDMVYIESEHQFEGDYQPKACLIPVKIKAPGKAAQGKAETKVEKKLGVAELKIQELKVERKTADKRIKELEQLSEDTLARAEKAEKDLEEFQPPVEGEEGAEAPAEGEEKEEK